MIFYVSMQGSKPPGQGQYITVEAACEATAIEKMARKKLNNWSTIYRTPNIVRRMKLEFWGKI